MVFTNKNLDEIVLKNINAHGPQGMVLV